jgi:hypothetical protein
MKNANQVPLEMPLEDLRSYALIIEEIKVKEVKKSYSTETKDSSNNSNHPPSQKRKRGMEKENSRKERKMVKDIIHIQFLIDTQSIDHHDIAIWLSTRDRKGSGILDLLEECLDWLIRIIWRVEALVVLRELSRCNHGV